MQLKGSACLPQPPTGLDVQAVAAHLLRRWRERRRIARMTGRVHAHLNGSIRPDGGCAPRGRQGLDAACLDRKRTLEVCFEIFALIHKCVDSLEIVAVIAREFLEANAHGCAHVELRTTPRALKPHGGGYVRTVVVC